MTGKKYHYYRVWYGDSNDRRELTDYIFKDRRGLIKAIDIDHAIAAVRRKYIGRNYNSIWEDAGEGDDTIAILDCTDYDHYEDCPKAQDPEADCECEASGDYIMIEEKTCQPKSTQSKP